jgi:hypothetical protein
MNAAEIATGAPNPAAPSMKAPKENAMMSAGAFDRRSRGDRVLHDLEGAARDRDVVEKDRGEDDPGDLHQAEGDSVEKARARERHGHAERKDGDDQRGDGASRRGPGRAHSPEGEEVEEHHDREAREKGRCRPEAERIVVLVPGSHNGAEEYPRREAESKRRRASP